MTDIQSLTLEELTEKMLSLGEKKFRAEQVFHDIMLGKKIDEISTISQELKSKLKEQFSDEPLTILTQKNQMTAHQSFCINYQTATLLKVF